VLAAREEPDAELESDFGERAIGRSFVAAEADVRVRLNASATWRSIKNSSRTSRVNAVASPKS
jgi:hypothetical protein